MSFPDVVFGRCPVCGARGDDADVSSISSADASTSDVGNGVELVYHRGQYICEVCKNRLVSDDESMASARRQAKEERFRQNAGFRKTID